MWIECEICVFVVIFLVAEIGSAEISDFELNSSGNTGLEP